jgi:hypothetical protein
MSVFVKLLNVGRVSESITPNEQVLRLWLARLFRLPTTKAQFLFQKPNIRTEAQ